MAIVAIVISCGAPKEREPAAKSAKFDPYAKLTEGEISRFIKAFPIFIEEAKKHGKALEKWESKKNPLAFAGAYGEFMGRFKALDATVRAKTGVGVEDVIATYIKTVITFGMLEAKKGMETYDQAISSIEEQLKNPNLPEERRETLTEQLKLYQEIKANIDTMMQKIPPENFELVKKYREKLKEVLEQID
ncbi:hypothetical protein DRP53_07405 [candidate division WOR-3 bacterium]|uniref:Uncharacterized protein n=1 Tax=candidate division WOR-3 bacterium TaxID=2052148 RepID=A0A660SFX3_UNCW3|nr:MAG: hypothetical protein DRP53_07405 [candidate division WOR-3 bacterium]